MRVFLIVTMLIVIFVGLPLAGTGAYFWRFYSPVPTASYGEPQDATDARRQDLDYLSRLPEIDRSFSDEEVVRFQDHLAQMNDRVDTLTDAEFFMGVAAAAAISENGHTNVYRRNMFSRLNSLPVRFFWFGDGLHIVRSHTSEAGLLGARVIAYEGLSPDTLVESLDPYYGGNEQFLRYNSPMFFASPAAMHAAGLAAEPDRITLTLEFTDGTVGQRTLEVEVRTTPSMRIDGYLNAILSEQEIESGNEWHFLNAGTDEVAQFSRKPGVDLWWESLPNDGAYIRLWQIYGAAEDGTPIGSWLNALRENLLEQPAKYVVLDLRSNRGGDLTLAMNFARRIADLITPDGHIYILTDGGTFSAGIVTAAFAVHGAGDRGTIIGEHVGDFEQFWAEGGGPMRLPNSELRIGITTGYHDWEQGCESFTRCYWISVIFGVAAGPLDPDVIAPLTYADFARGVDTGIQTVFEAEGIGD